MLTNHKTVPLLTQVNHESAEMLIQLVTHAETWYATNRTTKTKPAKGVTV